MDLMPFVFRFDYFFHCGRWKAFALQSHTDEECVEKAIAFLLFKHCITASGARRYGGLEGTLDRLEHKAN